MQCASNFKLPCKTLSIFVSKQKALIYPPILKVYIVLDTPQEQEIQETHMRITSIPEFYNIDIYKCASGRIVSKQLGVNVILMFYQLTMGSTQVLSSELILSW
jgi:hypothetical protein